MIRKERVDGFLVACFGGGPKFGFDHYMPMAIIPAVWEYLVFSTWGNKNFWKPYDFKPEHDKEYHFYWTKDLTAIIPEKSKFLEGMARKGEIESSTFERYKERESNDIGKFRELYLKIERNALEDWNNFTHDYLSLTKEGLEKARSAYLFPAVPAPSPDLQNIPAEKLGPAEKAERKRILFEEIENNVGTQMALAVVAGLYAPPNKFSDVFEIQYPNGEYDDSERRRIKKAITDIDKRFNKSTGLVDLLRKSKRKAKK